MASRSRARCRFREHLVEGDAMFRMKQPDIETIDWSIIEPCNLLIVVADYHKDITDMLLTGAAARFQSRLKTSLDTVSIAGALEIPPVIRHASDTGKYDGYLALGCVIRGETSHYDIVIRETARGLTLLGTHRLLIANGVLAAENPEQAIARADPGREDRGGEAADALLRLMLATKFVARSPESD